MIIGLLASKGNVGRADLAMNLAEVALDQSGNKCSLYEMDICHPKILSKFSWNGSKVTRKVSKVIHEKCKMVGKCLEACKFGAIVKADDKIGRRTGICRGCGLCREVCPEGAIDWEEIEAGEIGRLEDGNLVVVGGRQANDNHWEGFLIKKIQEEYPIDPDQNVIIRAPLGLGATSLRAVKQAEVMVLCTASHPTLEHEVSTFGQIVQGFGIPGAIAFKGSTLPDALNSQAKDFGLETFQIPESDASKDSALKENLTKIWQLGGGEY